MDSKDHKEPFSKTSWLSIVTHSLLLLEYSQVCTEGIKSPSSVCVSCLQIPKFIVTQVRQQNMENQRKQNKERAVRKLLKKITTDKPSDKAVPEVRVFTIWLQRYAYWWQSTGNNPLFVSRSHWLFYHSTTTHGLRHILLFIWLSNLNVLFFY